MFIHARNLHKFYGRRKIVSGVNLDVHENEILAVIGSNGAGKSTTIEMLIGLRKADAGHIKYWLETYKEKMGVQLQTAPFFVGLNASENLKLFASFYRKKLTDEEVQGVLKMCGLAHVGKVEASKLSGGQQKRLAICIALIHNPELIFLDEPTAALDPRARQEIHELIRELQYQGKTVVFTSHDMAEVEKLATRIVMIDQGQIIVEGKTDQLCKAYNIESLETLYLQLSEGRHQHVPSNF